MAESTQTPHKKIERLSEQLINQIAAGEVVERPSSIVKELVENSLDAGATQIEVLLHDGGISAITVIDNGHGITESDLPLSIERHATSKVQNEKDLVNIQTLGFRGEALSSIAAVSMLEIKSRTAQNASGYVLKITQGKWDNKITPIGMPVGTVISVKDLFEMVPARKKFLRSENTEFFHCAQIVKELALSSPHVVFHVDHQGKRFRSYTARYPMDRFKEILSPAAKPWEPMVIEESHDNLHLQAFLMPAHIMQNKGELYLIVNGRSVKNRALLAAVRNAYRDTCGAGHDPSGAIYLKIREDLVDVNVHPQKLEVRCFQQEKIYSWLVTLVRKAITSSHGVGEIALSRSHYPTDAIASVPSYANTSDPIHAPSYIGERQGTCNTQDTCNPRNATQDTRDTCNTQDTRDPHDAIAMQRTSGAQHGLVPRVKPDSAALFPKLLEEDESRIRYIGQLKATYLICEDDKGVILVDQHALHEKIMFEKLVESYQNGAARSQSLLIPLVLRLPKEKQAFIGTISGMLAKLGFEIENFGDGDIAVKSRPAELDESKVEIVLNSSLDMLLAESGSEDIVSRIMRPVFATMACHSVVRANQKLCAEEANALLRGLWHIKEGWTCPHGRPVILRLSFFEIEKHFGRH